MQPLIGGEVRQRVQRGMAALALLALNVGVAQSQSITGSSDYTTPQNTSGNVAEYTVQNGATPRTIYFVCSSNDAVTGCTTPAPLPLGADEVTTVSVVYSTGPWGSGYLGFAIANEMGEEWESRGSQITVTSPPQPVILSTAPHNEHFLNPPGCAVGCFHAGASFTTPAYVSGDVARSVTLVYSREALHR